MNALELRKAYLALSEKERLLFASLVATDQMIRQSDFTTQLEKRHEAMDAGKKWSHSDVLDLHRELEKQGL